MAVGFAAGFLAAVAVMQIGGRKRVRSVH